MERTKKTFGEKLLSIITILFLILTGIIIIDKYSQKKDDFVIEPTPISVQEIRSVKKLYLASIPVEEMVCDTVSRFGPDCTCIQTLRQNVYFVMNMENIKIEFDRTKVYVTLPEISYEANTAHTELISSDPDRFKILDYDDNKNSNELIKQVEEKIKQRIFIEDNIKKAEEQAKAILRGVFSQSGKEVVFTESILLSNEK